MKRENDIKKNGLLNTIMRFLQEFYLFCSC